MKNSLVTLLFLAVLGQASAADLFVGVWKIDDAKSSTTAGPVKEQRTLTYQAIANGYETTSQIDSNPAGKETLLFDGKEHKPGQLRIIENTGATAMVARRVSAAVIEVDYLRDGKKVATSRREVSDDGRVLTTTTDGTHLNGSKIHNTFVFRKS